jgi:hypothetical protein
MATATVDEKKLEDLVERAVQKHLDLTFQDMEKVRQSPAAAIIRVEARLDAIEARLDRDMVTRAEFKEEMANLRAELRTESREGLSNLRTELKDEIWKLRLYIILLGVLIVLTNPKVLELLGKLLRIITP